MQESPELLRIDHPTPDTVTLFSTRSGKYCVDDGNQNVVCNSSTPQSFTYRSFNNNARIALQGARGWCTDSGRNIQCNARNAQNANTRFIVRAPAPATPVPVPETPAPTPTPALAPETTPVPATAPVPDTPASPVPTPIQVVKAIPEPTPTPSPTVVVVPAPESSSATSAPSASASDNGVVPPIVSDTPSAPPVPTPEFAQTVDSPIQTDEGDAATMQTTLIVVLPIALGLTLVGAMLLRRRLRAR
jgi:hypothetical protein